MDIDLFNEFQVEDGLRPVPTRWEICDRCRGDGELGGYPGVYTQDDFASGEVDFEDYIAHRRSCEDCRGTGKVKVADWESCSVEQRALLTSWASEEAADAATRRAESGYAW